jgi:hypothetical protein
MSLNSAADRIGADGMSRVIHVPRLTFTGGGYSAWRPNMEVYLQRAGAEDIHKEPMGEQEWLTTSAQVRDWARQADKEALALVLGAASSSGKGNSDTDGSLLHSDKVREARRRVTALVDRSRKVFGALFDALPEELRVQVAHLPQGWAYGLWHWLETKYQNTEEDCVNDLIKQWMQLQMEEEETFDAYRARVNRINSLLELAKEKPSARQYSFTLTDKLQPRFRQAVLALKASGQLKDAGAVQWEVVTAFINAHERSESRLAADGSGSSVDTVMVARGVGDRASFRKKMQRDGHGESGDRADFRMKQQRDGDGESERNDGRRPRTLAEVQCFNCEKFGHLSSRCFQPRNTVGMSQGNVQGGGRRRDAGGGKSEHAALAVTAEGWHGKLTSDSDGDTEEDNGKACAY